MSSFQLVALSPDRLLRAYDRAHMMIAADVCAGSDVATEIERRFDNPLVGYIHLHNAQRGCFSCSVQRAAGSDDDGS